MTDVALMVEVCNALAASVLLELVSVCATVRLMVAFDITAP
jgi:hypothetical protein